MFISAGCREMLESFHFCGRNIFQLRYRMLVCVKSDKNFFRKGVLRGECETCLEMK